MNKDYRFYLLYMIIIYSSSFFLKAEDEVCFGNFRWAVGPEVTKDQYQNQRVFSNHSKKLIFYFIPLSNSYLYLFSISETKEFKLIFPISLADLNDDTYYYSLYEFDQDKIWPFMDSSCSETFALVSTLQLHDFEKLIKLYNKARNNEKINIFSDILMYIDSLRSRRFISNTSCTPWANNSMPPEMETLGGKEIQVIPEQFNYYYEIMFKYECK